MTDIGMLNEFESHRPRLMSIARRLLGSASDAEDTLQDAWLKLAGNASAIDNIGGWLTTVVSRLCLDRLRSRKRRAEDALDPVEEKIVSTNDLPDAARDLADAVGDAMAQVIERLHPAEAVAHFFSGRAQTAELAMVDGDPGIIIAPTGVVALALRISFVGNRIAAIEAIADPAFIAEMAIRAID